MALASGAFRASIPCAGLWARGTLIVTGLIVLFLNTRVLGAEATGGSLEPLLDGFRAEEYALSGGLHGDPQKEGYDAMEAEVCEAPEAEPKP